MKKYMIAILTVLLMTGCSAYENNTNQIVEKFSEVIEGIGEEKAEYVSVSFQSDEVEQLNIWSESSGTKYCVLDLKGLIDLLSMDCVNNDVTDTFKDENSCYMTVITKGFSMGLEHHKYDIKIKDDIVELKDTYTWGATGDKYGSMLIIKVPTEEYTLQYLNNFMYEDYN